MSTITLNLNAATMELTASEMEELYALTQLPGWSILQRLMDAIDEGTRLELEDASTPLDSIRGLQGRLGVAKDLRSLLNEGVPKWIKAMRERAEEGAE